MTAKSKERVSMVESRTCETDVANPGRTHRKVHVLLWILFAGVGIAGMVGISKFTSRAAAQAPATQPTTGGAAKSVSGAKYTATAYLRVARREPYLIFPSDKEDATEFDFFKALQVQLMKSPAVLVAALRDSKVRALASVRRQATPERMIAWLKNELQVGFPNGNLEFMQVSLTGSDPEEAALLVNSVIRAYFEEVVNAERMRRRARLNEIQQVYAEKENELRTKKTELKQLAETLDIDVASGGAVRQQVAVTRLLESHKELAGLKRDLRRARAELAADPAGGADAKRREAQIAMLDRLVQECQKDVDQYTKEAKLAGRSSVDIDMMQAELRHGEDVLRAIVLERDKLRIELRAAPRVTILGDPNQPAAVPLNPD